MKKQSCLDCGSSLDSSKDVDYEFLCQECGDWLSGLAPQAVIRS